MGWSTKKDVCAAEDVTSQDQIDADIKAKIHKSRRHLTPPHQQTSLMFGGGVGWRWTVRVLQGPVGSRRDGIFAMCDP